MRDLRNILEAIGSALDRKEYQCEKAASLGRESLETQSISYSVKSALAICLAELRLLESQVQPEHVQDVLESRTKAFLHSLSWRLKDNATKECIVRLQRCKPALNLAISASTS